MPVFFVLDATNKSITAELSAAPTTTNPDFVSTWADITTTTGPTQGSSDGVLNGVTPVTIIGSPLALTQRVVQFFEIANIDTAPVTVTLKYLNGASTRKLGSWTLAVGDKLRADGVYDSNGSLKTVFSSSLYALDSAVVHNTGTENVAGVKTFTTGAAIKGATGGASAAAGYIGEYIQSTAAGVAFPATDVWGDVTSISLTAGDWDISLNFVAYMQGTTGATYINSGISSTSGNSAAGLTLGDNETQVNRTFAADEIDSIPIVEWRVLPTATTTYYAKMRAGYTGGSPNVYCRLSARRRA